jgi:hypothetical protein
MYFVGYRAITSINSIHMLNIYIFCRRVFNSEEPPDSLIEERVEKFDISGGTCGFHGGRRIIDGQEVSKLSDCHIPAVYRTLRYISRADLPFCWMQPTALKSLCSFVLHTDVLYVARRW